MSSKDDGGPIQWRDRIHSIDSTKKAAQEAHNAAMASLDAERASLVAKLKAEGFVLVDEANGDPSDDDWMW